MNTSTITVKAVNVKEKKVFTYKSGAKKGQSGFLYPIGLNIGGKWVNGTAFSEEEADIFRGLKDGDKLTVILFEEEYNGKMYEKFKLPGEREQVKAEIEALKSEITTLKATIKSIVEVNKLKYLKPKQEVEVNYDNTDLPF